ncbi:MAG TPA: GTP-binding protein [Candidatus Dormibacteraeota bacterium]|nr:GTP-binding protein [Candidatus Dormibacteraeota bacterium]
MTAGTLGAPPRSRESSRVALLRLAAVGAVDDGKSTLIGRLLHDADQLTDDQLAALESASRARGQSSLNLSYATDGLKAEREQGITIDVAYRYAVTPRRKLVIADCPGHLEYTRNMATGASTADLALVVVDVTLGLREQTRRHTALALLFGVRYLLVAVNKMDLVGWDEPAYRAVTEQMQELAQLLGGAEVQAVPISALYGDNVVERSGNAPWYLGPTVLEALEEVPTSTFAAHGSKGARLPVQSVNSEADGRVRIAGMLTGAGLHTGDAVVVLPQGQLTTVASMETVSGAVQSAQAPLSISLTLADRCDVGRGDLIAAALDPPPVFRDQLATVCWFAKRRLESGQTFLIKHTTRITSGAVAGIESRLDLETLRLVPARELGANDIGVVRWRLAEPMAADWYRDSRVTGSLIVIDPDTHVTLAAAMIGTPTLR